MTTYDFVHLAMSALKDEIKGKTKLQKIVYFLGLMTGHEEELGYRPHYYGPYSDEVAAAVDRLQALGFLDVTVAGGGAFDSRGFEVVRHDYRLNDSGRKVAGSKKSQHAEVWTEIERSAAALKKLFDLDYMELSIAAKTLFLLGEKRDNASHGDLAALASKFGWSVTPEQIEHAVGHLQHAGLIKMARN